MTKVLYKKQHVALSDGVTLIQDINYDNSPLEYAAYKVLELKKGAQYTEKLSNLEACVVVLTGRVNISVGQEKYENLGKRTSVFDRVPTDSLYLNHNQTFEISAQSNCRVLIAFAPSDKKLPNHLIKAETIIPEHRGKYSNKRTALNILADDDNYANSLLVVEVFTDAGNWSSYPPHKHDTNNPPEESFLEEMYYHEIHPDNGFVFQRVYTEDRSLDETNAVYNQDGIIVPKGYHPVAVPDGYDSYYLNVMAGPVRIWNFHNEAEHEWIINRD